MKPQVEIDPEFQARIPPLSTQEKEQLRANLVQAGRARDKLTAWETEGRTLLLDGHNRLEVCKEMGLPFEVEVLDLPDREAALDWIDCNQMGRRNLTPDQMAMLLGRRYNRTKKDNGKRGPEKLVQNEPAFARTSATLAAEHGVSEMTVRRAGEFAAAVEKLGIEKEVLANEIEAPRKKIVEAAKALPKKPTPEQVKEVVQAVKEDRPLPSKQEALPGMGNPRPNLSKAQLKALPPQMGRAVANRAIRILEDIQDHDAQLEDAIKLLRGWCNDKEAKSKRS